MEDQDIFSAGVSVSGAVRISDFKEKYRTDSGGSDRQFYYQTYNEHINPLTPHDL
jgi:hypothetical protein